VALVALTTLGLVGLAYISELPNVSIVYLIPVLISATRWGIFPAITAALASIAASAFFFYPPIYSLQVHNPLQLFDIALFVLVAVVTGQLANSVRSHVAMLHQRESEMRALYAFSRELAVASGSREIYAAIQDHLGRFSVGALFCSKACPGRSGWVRNLPEIKFPQWCTGPSPISWNRPPKMRV
jgi:two-component system sensor histidine kinase KdpD